MFGPKRHSEYIKVYRRRSKEYKQTKRGNRNRKRRKCTETPFKGSIRHRIHDGRRRPDPWTGKGSIPYSKEEPYHW